MNEKKRESFFHNIFQQLELSSSGDNDNNNFENGQICYEICWFYVVDTKLSSLGVCSEKFKLLSLQAYKLTRFLSKVLAWYFAHNPVR